MNVLALILTFWIIATARLAASELPGLTTHLRNCGPLRGPEVLSLQLHRSVVTPADLAWHFGISEELAGEPLAKTTQHAMRVKVDHLTRWFRTRQAQVGKKVFPAGVWSDTFFLDTKSILGNDCGQFGICNNVRDRARR